MKVYLALMALALLTSAPVMAQEGSAMSVDLQTAMSNAVQHNKQLQASALDRETYYQKIREARSQGLPQVNASLTGTTYFNKALDFGGMQMSMPNSLTFAASASWTFAMQQVASVKVAKIAERLTDVTVKQTELDVKANVADTYFAILVYERNLQILHENLKDMQDIANHTAHCFEVGTVEQTDVDEININVTMLENAILSLQRSLESTKKLLVLQMGVDINTKISTAQTLDQVLDANEGIDTAKLDISKNLQYQQLMVSKEVGEQTIKLRKFAYIPTLTASYQYSKPLSDGAFMNFDHVGNLVLSIPIFSGFQRHSQLKQAQIDLRKTETNIALLEDNLAQNAEQYAFDLQTAIDAYELQKNNLDVARRVLQNYRHKYDQGALSSLDLTQANTNYLQAETSYASASLDLLMAQTKLLKLYNLL